MLDKNAKVWKTTPFATKVLVLNGLLCHDGKKLAQVRYFIFSSLVASMDFQLILDIRLCILNWLFMMNCTYFLLVVKTQYMFPAFPSHYFSLGLSCFLSISCTLPLTLPFLKLFSLPGVPSLPYFYLKAWPFCSAISNVLLKTFFFMYLPEYEYTAIFQGKTTPLLLSNLCLFCSLLFNYECFLFSFFQPWMFSMQEFCLFWLYNFSLCLLAYTSRKMELN